MVQNLDAGYSMDIPGKTSPKIHIQGTPDAQRDLDLSRLDSPLWIRVQWTGVSKLWDILYSEFYVCMYYK